MFDSQTPKLSVAKSQTRIIYSDNGTLPDHTSSTVIYTTNLLIKIMTIDPHCHYCYLRQGCFVLGCNLFAHAHNYSKTFACIIISFYMGGVSPVLVDITRKNKLGFLNFGKDQDHILHIKTLECRKVPFSLNLQCFEFVPSILLYIFMVL